MDDDTRTPRERLRDQQATDRAVVAGILIGGILLIVVWVLTSIQGACLDYWSSVGGTTPPCWLPFGGN